MQPSRKTLIPPGSRVSLAKPFSFACGGRQAESDAQMRANPADGWVLYIMLVL